MCVCCIKSCSLGVPIYSCKTQGYSQTAESIPRSRWAECIHPSCWSPQAAAVANIDDAVDVSIDDGADPDDHIGADNAADADNRVNAAAYDAVDAFNGGVGARNSVRPDL